MSTDKPEAPAMAGDPKQQIIKLLLELGPLVVFFVMNGRVGIIDATAWFMAFAILGAGLSGVD